MSNLNFSIGFSNLKNSVHQMALKTCKIAVAVAAICHFPVDERTVLQKRNTTESQLN